MKKYNLLKNQHNLRIFYLKIHQLRKKLIGTAGVVALPKEDVSCSRDLGVRKDVSSAEVLTMKQIYAVIQLMTKDAYAAAPT